MSALRQALDKLDNAVGKLEGSINSYDQSVEGRQTDMFGGAAISNGNANANVNAAFVAQKLDSAIEKVEHLLKENA